MLLLGSSGTGSHGEIAKAVDFDGTNDYLSRASDFTGNADGKTFTFSAWVWNTAGSPGDFYKSSSRFRIDITSSNLRITAQDSAANPVLVYTNTNFTSQIEIGTFYHVLISVDLTNVSKRHVYVNDVAIAGGSWDTYTNSNIDFTNNTHGVGENFKGRLAHVFLDYTYRDLSVEANRRLFITADRKPAANQAALNPILYLPLNDPPQPGKNLGTGGDFALTGVVARSGRGPNQFNAPYSDLDGSADYLSRTGALLVSGSKVVTFSCSFTPDSVATDQYLFGFWTSVSVISQIFGIWVGADGSFGINGQVAPGEGGFILDANSQAGVLKVGRNYTLQFSIDLADVSKRFAYLNGNQITMTWATYIDDFIFFNQASNSPITSVGRSRSFYFNGRLGNVFFDTKYIDLSQPANLAKFVTGTGIDAKPADLGANGELPFGTPPLIYLPMYGNNAGKNYGTGGDFTVNSGPYPGARGPNEFWGNKADFDGSTGYLARTSALTGIAASKTLSLSFWANKDVTSQQTLLHIETSGGAYRLYLDYDNATTTVALRVTNSSGIDVLYVRWSPPIVSSSVSITHSCINVDLSNISNRSVYVDGSPATVTWATYTNDLMDLVNPNVNIGAWQGASQFFNGRLSEFYFTTDYIDFSQEANRLLFRDAFGNPTDLPAAIAKGTVPNPAIYMRFDPANQGLNSGTGGNFTKSGTITDGGQL